MADPDRIEELENRIAQLENQVRILTDKLGTAQAPADLVKAKQIEAEQVKIVESDGTVRVSLHNADRMLDPDRVGGAHAGLLFFAEDGEEVGGLSGGKTQSLSFDQHLSGDVVKVMNGSAIKGLYVWDRPPMPMSVYEEQFEKEHGRPPNALEREFTRVFAGRWFTGEAKVSLGDSRGRERIRILVDGDDRPRIEFLDENGQVIQILAPEDYKPLELPPCDSLPRDRGDRTPAHVLALFGNDFDKVLDLVDDLRRELGDEGCELWRDWLVAAKKMNESDGTE